jgi:hypothetical protein
MGKVQIKKNNGNQLLLKEVRHVPYLRKSLISTRNLESEGCISIFTYKVWKVTKGSLVIEKGEKVGTLYLCTGNIDSYIPLASTEVDTTLWHHRIRQMSEKGMQILHKIIFFLDLKKIDLDFCEHYVYGKQKRVIFLRVRKEKKSERLELVHTDVRGLSQVSSLVDLVIMLLLLMMQLEKLGFITFNKNLMFLTLLRNENLWLRMRQEKG